MKDLDDLIVNVELTLISIIQGVALSFLVENAHGPLLERDYLFWPYVGVGLLTIFIFWSRSIMHTLTVIGWPIEFGHNFFYVGSTLLEAVIFTQLKDPSHWFLLNGIYSAIVWVLFIFDLRLIRRLKEDGEGTAEKALVARVEEDQWMNIRVLMPSTVVFCLLSWILVSQWPQVFLERGWHAALALFQLVAASIYLSKSLRFYRDVAPLVVQARREWYRE